MTVKITYPFTTPANYIYDSSKIEISGGIAKLKSQIPDNATFYAPYSTDINGAWGDGVLTGTAIGGAAVVGGKLDLAHNDVRYVDYDADLNADSQQYGCARVLITPNYTGPPPAGNPIFAILRDTGSLINMIYLAHMPTGDVRAFFYDSAGTEIKTTVFDTFNPSSGTEYELELNWDLTGGDIRFFVNGTQSGTTQTGIGTRDSNVGILRIGSNTGGTLAVNCYFRKFIVFDSVQHTGNYTPFQDISESIYLKTNPPVEMNTAFSCESMEGFTETSTKTGSDEIKYILKKGNTWYYHNGSSWVISDGTYAQSNTAAEIELNKATFTTTGVTVRTKLFLHSNDGLTTPKIDTLEVDFNFYAGTPTIPNTCIVYGYCYDENNNPLQGVQVTIALSLNKTIYNDEILLITDNLITTSDSTGYWDISLIESTTLDSKYVFTFTYDSKSRTYIRIIPNEISKNFAELESS